MRIERHGVDWLGVLNIARLTQNKPPATKEPSEEWKRKLITSRHSPLRLIQFLVVGEVPGFVCTHLARHTYQSPQPFIGTGRPDIMHTDKRPLDTAIRPFALYFNADSWIDIYEQRSCRKASRETREIVDSIRIKISKIEPLIADMSFRPCEKYGRCNEFEPCDYIGSGIYKIMRERFLGVYNADI